MPSHSESWYKKFFHSSLFVLVAFAVLIVIGVAYVRSFYQDYKIRQEIADLEDDIGALEHKKLESVQLLGYVMSQDYIEEKARIELNMKKPGENVLLFNTNSTGAGYEDTLSDLSLEAPREKISNLQKWWKYFSHQ